MRLAVCLPTYNERETLPAMAAALVSVIEQHGLDARVLVIDDRSPDGTGELADRLTGRYRQLSTLHRERKEGLGPAYLAGFRWALDQGAELVAQIDCDLSHDPADLPRLLRAVEDGAELAIGSRYTAGGSIRNWGRLRRAISRAGCLYAQTLLGVPVRDLTGGFKCYRREVLERIGLETVTSKGYAFQIEMTYRAARAGFSVVEVPIAFSERESGQSKMSGSIVAEAALRVPRLRIGALRGQL